MGITPKKISQKWTINEIEFLQKNYKEIRVPDLAKILKRSYYSVKKKMHKMRLILPDEIKTKIFIDCGKTTAKKLDFRGDRNPMWKGGITRDFYKAKKIQKLRYPERCKARDMLCRAVKTGKIKRGLCKICGSSETEGHHDDYSLPFDVIWLCKKHHMELHKETKNRDSCPCPNFLEE